MKKIYKLRIPITNEHFNLFSSEIEDILKKTVKRWETKSTTIMDSKYIYSPATVQYALEITALCTRVEYDSLLSRLDQELDVTVEVFQ